MIGRVSLSPSWLSFLKDGCLSTRKDSEIKQKLRNGPAEEGSVGIAYSFSRCVLKVFPRSTAAALRFVGDGVFEKLGDSHE